MSSVVSVRLPDELVHRLRDRAATAGEPVSGLAQRLVDEGLRMESHPGIVFRTSPGGRRARLVQGPDVWEVIGLIRSFESRGSEAVTEAAGWLGVPEAAVRAALSYYGGFPAEIDARIAANERAADEFRTRWETQQELLG